MTVGLDREHDARPRRVAVEEDRAGAAHAVFAPDVRACQAELVPEEITEEQPRLDVGLVADAVHRHAHDHATSAGPQSSPASMSAPQALRKAHRTRTSAPEPAPPVLTMGVPARNTPRDDACRPLMD